MKPTIIDLLNNSVEKYASNPFLWEKKFNVYESISYSEVQSQARVVAAGLIHLGVMPGDRIALLSEGRNAWIISELGLLHTGAINVPLSIKLEETNDLLFRIVHAECKYIIVSNSQLPKIRKITSELELVQKIIILDDQNEYREKEVPFSIILSEGEELMSREPELVNIRVKLVEPDHVATISYTSGTTADPKGVMLTHRNYTANVEQALTLMTIPTYYTTLIILPLDHCFAHVAGFYAVMASGASAGTVQLGKTGMETLKNIPLNIKELKPNFLLSVPALAKNFKKGIEQNIKAKGPVIEKLFNFALKISYAYNSEGFNKGKGLTVLYKPIIALFDKILFTKIRDGFGGNIDFLIGGGALLDIDLQRFFYAIGMPMFQGYGLSEATPIISSNSLKKHKLGSSGVLVTPIDLKILDFDGKEIATGEKGQIVVRGENVMAGYYKNPKATEEILKQDWLFTGDMGYLDNDGFLYVTGRFKSLLIGSDGEKYSPEGIEEALTSSSLLIEQVLLHNNQDPFTSAILVPAKDALKSRLKQTGLSLETEAGKREALRLLQHEIDAYKKGGQYEGEFPERWLPASVAVISEPFTEQNGLVNSTMKVVRGKVIEAYADRLAAIYNDPANKDIVNMANLEAVSLL